jgi:hypothetical protein
MLVFGIIMFTIGAWGGTHLSKDDKKKIYNQGYMKGFKTCQEGYIPEAYKRHIKINPHLQSKFRG